MAISYNGLWKQLIDHGMKKGDLCAKAHRGYETGTGHNGTAKGRKRLRMDRMPQ